ncbi:uncharacterized protein TNCV_2214201 [Trichonephila clavipes]|nr:uncharacterized protein TNCV_2214201 [Trichonephila clavipes]
MEVQHSFLHFSVRMETQCSLVEKSVEGLREANLVLSPQDMNMLEVADPKVCIIIDFRENGSFASQDLPFPSTALRLTPTEWLITQLNRHRKAFNWVKESQTAIEGLLLMNVERHSK